LRVWRVDYGQKRGPGGKQAAGQKIRANVTNYTHLLVQRIVLAFKDRNNTGMRALLSLAVAVGIAYAIYQYSLKRLPVSDAGTSATQAISLTGVRADLLQIAQAERANIATNGQCASLPEMLSFGAISMNRTERDGYAYEIKCSGAADFQVVARHDPAPQGSSIRYPTLAIDASMDIREIQ